MVELYCHNYNAGIELVVILARVVAEPTKCCGMRSGRSRRHGGAAGTGSHLVQNVIAHRDATARLPIDFEERGRAADLDRTQPG